MKMTARHKAFITDKLIPAIMRDQGRGFGMSWWHDQVDPGSFYESDGLIRKVPACGTVCCIGGTIDLLKNKDADPFSGGVKTGRTIGLNAERSRALFYGWTGVSVGIDGSWPDKYQKAYTKARTTAGKAGVACRLLREVVRTEGRCLDA